MQKVVAKSSMTNDFLSALPQKFEKWHHMSMFI